MRDHDPENTIHTIGARGKKAYRVIQYTHARGAYGDTTSFLRELKPPKNDERRGMQNTVDEEEKQIYSFVCTDTASSVAYERTQAKLCTSTMPSRTRAEDRPSRSILVTSCMISRIIF